MANLTKQQQMQMNSVLAAPGNNRCADCGLEKPTWASINLGLFLCMDCAGLHRSLGVHISKVRSISLDKWEPKWISYMQSVGNLKGNSFWEANMPPHRKIRPHCDMSLRTEFIKDKYEKRLFYGKPAAAKVGPVPPSTSTTSAPNTANTTSSTRIAAPTGAHQSTHAANARRQQHQHQQPATTESIADIFQGMQVKSSQPEPEPEPESEPAAPTATENANGDGKFVRRQNPRMAQASPWVQRKGDARPQQHQQPSAAAHTTTHTNAAPISEDLFSGMSISQAPTNGHTEEHQQSTQEASAFDFLGSDGADTADQSEPAFLNYDAEESSAPSSFAFIDSEPAAPAAAATTAHAASKPKPKQHVDLFADLGQSEGDAAPPTFDAHAQPNGNGATNSFDFLDYDASSQASAPVSDMMSQSTRSSQPIPPSQQQQQFMPPFNPAQMPYGMMAMPPQGQGQGMPQMPMMPMPMQGQPQQWMQGPQGQPMPYPPYGAAPYPYPPQGMYPHPYYPPPMAGSPPMQSPQGSPPPSMYGYPQSYASPPPQQPAPAPAPAPAPTSSAPDPFEMFALKK